MAYSNPDHQASPTSTAPSSVLRPEELGSKTKLIIIIDIADDPKAPVRPFAPSPRTRLIPAAGQPVPLPRLAARALNG